MSPAIRLLLLSCLVCSGGCFVPSLEELEGSNPPPYACNEMHSQCPANQMCIGGHCQAVMCMPGSTQSCGPATSQCGQGQQTCEADGTLGDCKTTPTSATERICGGVDANCDGRFGKDTTVAQGQAPGNFQNTVALASSSMIFVTAENTAGAGHGRNLVFYRLDQDGGSGQLNTSYPPADTQYLSPALIMAQDKSLVLAWIEQSVDGGSSFKLNVGQINESGTISHTVTLASPPFSAPGPGQGLYVTGLTLASSADTLLVLVSTNTTSASPEDMTGTRQTLLTTLPLSVSARAFTGFSTLASGLTQRYGLAATAMNDGTGFLVAYEDAGTAYSQEVSPQGVAFPFRFVLTTQASSVHSPYILSNTSGSDHIVYFVRTGLSVGGKTESQILSAKCVKPSDAPGTSVNCVSQSSVLFRDSHPIVRARMSAPSATSEPNRALIIERDEGSTQSDLSITALPNGTIDSAHPLVGFSTFSEQLLSVNGVSDRLYLTYQQRSDASSLEEHLLQLCNP